MVVKSRLNIPFFYPIISVLYSLFSLQKGIPEFDVFPYFVNILWIISLKMTNIHNRPNDQKSPTLLLVNVSIIFSKLLLVFWMQKHLTGPWEIWDYGQVLGELPILFFVLSLCDGKVSWMDSLWDQTMSGGSYEVVLDTEFWGNWNKDILRHLITWDSCFHWSFFLFIFLKTQTFKSNIYFH